MQENFIVAMDKDGDTVIEAGERVSGNLIMTGDAYAAGQGPARGISHESEGPEGITDEVKSFLILTLYIFIYLLYTFVD